MDDVDRVTVPVRLDRVLLEEASAAGLDLSEITERAIRRQLGPASDRAGGAEREKLRREIAEEVRWYNEHVERHGLFADEWRCF